MVNKVIAKGVKGKEVVTEVLDVSTAPVLYEPNKKLTDQQKVFCDFYTGKHFKNATASYREAYEVGYESAMASGSRLLSSVKIIDYIQYLLDTKGLSSYVLDYELSKLVHQDEDYKAKYLSIKLWNELLARCEKAKQKALDDGEISHHVITAKLPESIN